MQEKASDKQVGGTHYKSVAIQPLEFELMNGFTMVEATIIKYIFRALKKNGIEDLEKALHCIDLLEEWKDKYPDRFVYRGIVRGEHFVEQVLIPDGKSTEEQRRLIRYALATFLKSISIAHINAITLEDVRTAINLCIKSLKENT